MMTTKDEGSVDAGSCKGGTKIERVIYHAIKAALIVEGVDHGHASVRQLPDGDFAAVAGAGDLEQASFTPGGGGFGGGGASGSW